MKLCFATNNKNKISEVKALLGNEFDLIGLQDLGFIGELAEDFFTIEENSRQKAEFIFNKFHIDCFADDSGLEVISLDNSPGVRSARYAGEHKNDEANISLLLDNLQNTKNRAARFKTVVTLFFEGITYQFEGIVEGRIIEAKRGESGFGYDPIFVPSGYDRTFAEMSLHEKNTMSHRAIAVKKLTDFLKDKKTFK